ncbi:hypothetical protein ACFXPT_30890, partial [Streptomyces goshikiensis]|uniref:hypothetical protein n=1 Tax=Streptomyces goshikiensis TaxID=1942 RepID=UPI0036964174
HGNTEPQQAPTPASPHAPADAQPLPLPHPLTSVFDELHELGCFGLACLTLTGTLVRQETRRFPVLAPSAGWQKADEEDLLHEFLADRLQAVTANLLALATDDDSVGRLLRTSIRRWLIGQARETALGSVRRSLEKVLTECSAFEAVPPGEAGAGRWRLSGTMVQPWSGPPDLLVEAAYAVPNIKIPKWTSETRRAPLADRKSLEAVIRAVLSTAAGSIEVAQLVEVFIGRFPVALDPIVLPLPDDAKSQITASAHASPEEIVLASDDEAVAASAAAQIVAMLSPQERGMVAYLESPGELKAYLGCGRSQAYHHRTRLKEKLQQLVGNEDEDQVRSVGS